MIRIVTPLVAALTLSLAAPLAGPVSAQGVFVAPPPQVIDRQPLTGKRGRVAGELRNFGFGNADVATLSNQKIAVIDNIIHGSGSQSDKTNRIRSVLNGGFLQRALDRATGKR